MRKLGDVSLALNSMGIWASTAYHFLTQVVNRTSGLNGLFLSAGKFDDEAKYLW